MRCLSVAHARCSHKTKLCKAIERHLAVHPLAADTAQGIVASWLPAHGFEDAAEHIGEALEQLLADGRLRAYELPDGNVLYSAKVTAQ